MPIYDVGGGLFRVTLYRRGQQVERKVRGSRAQAEAALAALLRSPIAKRTQSTAERITAWHRVGRGLAR